MTDGLTTGRAHLDPMDSVAPTVGEIDDVELLAWLRTTDFGHNRVKSVEASA